MWRGGRYVWMVGLCVGLARTAGAQDAAVSGRVQAAGTAVPVASARVELLHGAVVAYSEATPDDGRFDFVAVTPGEYRLRAAAPGYFTIERDLVLRPRQSIQVVVELPFQTVTEQVEVHASAQQLDPQRTENSRVLTARRIEAFAAPFTGDVPALAEHVMPGAVLGHDNFVHVRGNELSLHQFINGVSFLDNAHQHFTAGLSPQIFETVNFVAGGFPAEFGNRFGGILDVTTRSGRALGGRGAAAIGVGSVGHRDGVVDYGGSAGRFGYYVFGGASGSDRYLNPPDAKERHDSGYVVRGAGQLDYQGDRNMVKLFVAGGGSRFDIPNTVEEEELGRDATRSIDSQTAILTWQRTFSASSLLSTSLYERTVSDRLHPTPDPQTPLADGSRSTRTLGFKADWWRTVGDHRLKAGIDIAAVRLGERVTFDPRDGHEERRPDVPHRDAPTDAGDANEVELEAFAFQAQQTARSYGFYVQDRFSPVGNLTLDVGARVDRWELFGADTELSPRVGVAYHLPASRSVARFAYNRLFTPPPIEYVLLAGFLGDALAVADGAGDVKPYTQHHIEVGWSQQVHRDLFVNLGAYRYTGENAFETTELSSSRLFLPTNFDEARAKGFEVGLDARPDAPQGLSGRVQYALAKVEFVAPISGGFAAEAHEPGEEIAPAFDQRHTLTFEAFYRDPWRNVQFGVVTRYGSGTPVEQENDVGGEVVERIVRLPDHWTFDLSARIDLWRRGEQAVSLEFDGTNLTNNIYAIGKESEATPVQFAPRRTLSGRVKWRF